MDRQLLILDLDETLVYSTEQPLERECDFRIEQYFVHKRPFLAEFLAAVPEGFLTAVWSSASGMYVQAVVEQLFPDPTALQFVWSRDRCTQRLDAETLDLYWVKDLKKVKRFGFPLERILMIDDSPRKLERQYGNHLRLSTYLGEPDDGELLQVLPFLDHLRSFGNLRAVEKRYWREFVANGVSPNKLL
jgi:RNA polymerase II subunit A small phosphatase-like protein